MRYAQGASERESLWSKYWLARFAYAQNTNTHNNVRYTLMLNYMTLSLTSHNQLLPLAAPHSRSPLMISLAATHFVFASHQISQHTQSGQGEMIKKRPENKNNRATVRWKLKRPTKITRLSLSAHPLFFALALLSPFLSSSKCPRVCLVGRRLQTALHTARAPAGCESLPCTFIPCGMRGFNI